MDLPEGAVELHLYNIKNILRPRGGVMKKESLSAYLFYRLDYLIQTWSDPKYGDSIDKQELSELLWKNLHEEINTAWETILVKHDIKKMPEE
jgi:hypothetical protein